MKKRLLVILVAVAMIVCSMATMSFAAETKAVYDFSSQEFQQTHPITISTENVATLKLTDDDVITVTLTGSKTYGYAGVAYEYGDYVHGIKFTSVDGILEIDAIDGYKITDIKFNIAPYTYTDMYSDTYKYFYGITKYNKKNSADVIVDSAANGFVAKANDTDEVTPEVNDEENYEEYVLDPTKSVTKFTVSADNASYWPYISSIEVTYEAPETPAVTPTAAGANTGDSNSIALYSIVAILALAGAGFVYKRREN